MKIWKYMKLGKSCLFLPCLVQNSVILLTAGDPQKTPAGCRKMLSTRASMPGELFVIQSQLSHPKHTGLLLVKNREYLTFIDRNRLGCDEGAGSHCGQNLKQIHTEERLRDKLASQWVLKIISSQILKRKLHKYIHTHRWKSYYKCVFLSSQRCWVSRTEVLVLNRTGSDGEDHTLRSTAGILKCDSFTKSCHQRIYTWTNYCNLPQKWLHRIVIHFGFLVFVEGYYWSDNMKN